MAALPVFTIDGMTKQMKCVTEAKCIGVNPDCENFEMTIALATYLGSADSQQMHYDMSGVIPVNLSAVQTLRSDVEFSRRDRPDRRQRESGLGFAGRGRRGIVLSGKLRHGKG